MSTTIGLQSYNYAARVRIGGESKRFDLARTLATAFTKVVADVLLNLPAGQAVGSPTTLWDSGLTATGGTLTAQFTWGVLIADPDSANATAQNLDIEITDRVGGASILRTQRITRDRPAIFNSIGGATLTLLDGAAPSQIVLIRARNPAVADATGATDVKCRLLLLA